MDDAHGTCGRPPAARAPQPTHTTRRHTHCRQRMHPWMERNNHAFKCTFCFHGSAVQCSAVCARQTNWHCRRSGTVLGSTRPDIAPLCVAIHTAARPADRWNHSRGLRIADTTNQPTDSAPSHPTLDAEPCRRFQHSSNFLCCCIIGTVLSSRPPLLPPCRPSSCSSRSQAKTCTCPLPGCSQISQSAHTMSINMTL